MRPAGLTLAALLVGLSAAAAQPPGPGGTPPGPGVQPPPAAAPKPDPGLDAHLKGWEDTMKAVTTLRVELSLTRKDAVRQVPKEYAGVVLCMKPNLAILRLDYTGDKTGRDYEAFICNGKAVYAYNGSDKTITEFKIPDPAKNPAGATDNLMLDFLSGMKAKEAKERFDLTVFKEDQHYVYLDVKPKLGKDKQEFQQLRLALYGPNTKVAYLPAQVYLVKPNGDTELWKCSNPQTNLPGIDEKVFVYKPVNEPGWRTVQAPNGGPQPPPPPLRPMPGALPGGTGLPTGPGAVRPGVPPKPGP